MFFFQKSAKLISFSQSLNQLRLDNLRSLSFFKIGDDEEKFFLKSQYDDLLDLILHGTPNLVELSIYWDQIMHIDSPFVKGRFLNVPLLNLRQLYVYHYGRKCSKLFAF